MSQMSCIFHSYYLSVFLCLCLFYLIPHFIFNSWCFIFNLFHSISKAFNSVCFNWGIELFISRMLIWFSSQLELGLFIVFKIVSQSETIGLLSRWHLATALWDKWSDRMSFFTKASFPHQSNKCLTKSVHLVYALQEVYRPILRPQFPVCCQKHLATSSPTPGDLGMSLALFSAFYCNLGFSITFCCPAKYDTLPLCLSSECGLSCVSCLFSFIESTWWMPPISPLTPPLYISIV
jgi:hypothetical protein